MNETQYLALTHAVETNNLSTIKALLSHEIDLQATSPLDKKISYLIHLAAKNGQLSVIKLLLNNNPKLLNHTDAEGLTSLYWAAKNGHTAVVKYLVLCPGVNLANSNAAGSRRPALQYAAKNGYYDVVRILLRAGANPRFKNEHLIHLAAEIGHLNMIKLCLTMRPSLLNYTNTFGQTPLMCAARCGHASVVQYLVSRKGINLKVTTTNLAESSHHFTAIHWAVYGGYCGIVKILIKAGAREDSVNGLRPIHLAAKKGHLPMVKLCLNKRPDLLNSTDADGLTPLAWAAKRGEIAVVRYLVSRKGIVLNERDKQNYTALHLAIMCGYCPIVAILIKAGAMDVPLKGFYAIHLATQEGHLDIVQFLIEENPELLNHPDNYRQTALVSAAGYGRVDIINYLMQQPNINLNVSTEYGLSPIAWALEKKQDLAANAFISNMINEDNKHTMLDFIQTAYQALDFIHCNPTYATFFLNNPRINALIRDECPSFSFYKYAENRRPSFFARINPDTGDSSVFKPNKQLGAGTYGIVRDFVNSEGEHVAVKSLKEGWINEESPVDSIHQNCLQEASLLAEAYPSNNSNHFFYFVKESTNTRKTSYTNYLITEYIDGETINVFLNKIESKHEVAKIIILMIMELISFHEKGFVHLDLHLNNIMIMEDGHNNLKCRLIDLGFSSKIDSILDERFRGGHFPEFCNNSSNLLKAQTTLDIFSFGNVLDRIINDHPKGILLINAYPSIMTFIKKALNKNPSNRPTLKSFYADLASDYQHEETCLKTDFTFNYTACR